MKLVLTQQETILAIQYYLVNAKNMQVDKVNIQYEGYTEPQIKIVYDPLKVVVDHSESHNPWLTPDKDGWFTHNPKWKNKEPPYYIVSTEQVAVKLRGFDYGDEYAEMASNWTWQVENGVGDIVKWKYAN